MRTAIFGDSLTAGLPGVSYWRYLRDKSKLLNRGVGGDTLLGMTNRLKRMLDDPRFADVGQYIVEIGTNDVLLYVLNNRSPIIKKIVAVREKTRGCVPCESFGSFAADYEALLELLLSRGKKVGVIGLPLIENTAAAVNRTMERYDAVIWDLCDKYGIAYLSLRQLEHRLKGGNTGSYELNKSLWWSVADALVTTILPFSMMVSKRRGLAVTVDSTHFNRKMAKELAAAVEETFLK